MNTDILFRLLIAIAMIVVGTGLYALYNRWMLRRAPKNSLGDTGKPVLLYFTAPTCAPCKTVQRPAIAQIQEKLGEMLRVIEIDATQQPDMAERWGVLSVPTTFVIDSRGQARYVNHGVARADKLLKQLNAL
jgi:thiol-disulfide isomerase/thioredoxin